jgi:hypothetical protein
MGRLDEALGQYSELLIDRERILGPDHLSTKSTRNSFDKLLNQLRGVQE